MKIIKYKKTSNNIYTIYLDNKESIKLYDDTIIKYNLLVIKEIDNLEEVLKYNKKLEAYYIALNYINKKMRTTKEVRKKLEDYPSEAINMAIERLTKEGYLNDKEYLRVFIKDQVNITSYGKLKIENKAMILGFSKEDIKNVLDSYDKSIFNSKLEKLIEKKIKNNSKYSVNKLKEKILIDLNGQGYDKGDILNILSSYEIKEPANILDKEYEKAYRVLSKKYEGYELKNKIIQKLVSKGFSYDIVKNRV